MNKEFRLGFDVRNERVSLTLKRSIKKAFFYEGGDFPYNFTYFESDLKNGILSISNSPFPDFLFEIYKVDAIIRRTDDFLDGELAKRKPLPLEEMRDAIKNFSKELPVAKKVSELFNKELAILAGNTTGKKLEKSIKEIIEVRPCDFFLLTDLIIDEFGTVLTKKELKNGKEFFTTFQTLRDLFDDMMSIEEDCIRKDYNSVVIGKENGVSHHFFEEIVNAKFDKLEKIIKKINDHKFNYLFPNTIEFWKTQYSLIFRPLLISYYINMDEFKANYFIIKQV